MRWPKKEESEEEEEGGKLAHGGLGMVHNREKEAPRERAAGRKKKK